MSAVPGAGALPGWPRVMAAGAILAALAALAVAHLSVGEPIVPPAELPGILMGDSGDRIEQLVVRELRVPRLILALLAGAGFGLSGAILL